MYILKRNSLNWLTECGLDGPPITLERLRIQYLLSPQPWMLKQSQSGDEGPRRFLECSQWCSVYVGIPKNRLLTTEKEWVCNKMDGLTSENESKWAKRKVSFFCQQKVLPKFRVGPPASNNLKFKKICHRSAQQLIQVQSIVSQCFHFFTWEQKCWF